MTATDPTIVRGWLRQLADARYHALRAIRSEYPPNHQFVFADTAFRAVGVSQSDGEIFLIAVREACPTEHHFIPARLLFPDPPATPPPEYHI